MFFAEEGKRQLEKYDSDVGGSRYRINQNIYRCWHKDQWIRFFDIMLNPPEDIEKAIIKQLLSWRKIQSRQVRSSTKKV